MSQGELKDHDLLIQVTRSMKEAFREYARRADTSMSDLVRGYIKHLLDTEMPQWRKGIFDYDD